MPGLPPVEERTLRAVYEQVLAASPDETAQVDESGTATFAESYQRSLRLAAGIAAHGVGHQEPAALLLDNSLDAVHVWSGIGLGGRVEVPVNTAYKGRFLTHVLNDSAAGLIVIEDGYAERLADVAGDLTALRTVVVRGDPGRAAALRGRFRVLPLDELEAHGEAAPAPGDAGELMAYMYTSAAAAASRRRGQSAPARGDGDRMKDALRRRGENISSFEVERVINEHPAVFESAVVGVPSALTEDEIKAVIVPRDGQRVDPVELTAFMVDRLPYFMVPRYLEFAAALPKTPTQKVHKHLLRDTGAGPGTWDREAAGIVLRRGSR
jgi:acyl-CoA synthetase (AMP-forming)/AMP-acid ligase II